MRAWGETVAWWAVLVLVWLATLNSFSFAELAVAAVLAVPCAWVARRARLAAGIRWSLRVRWARWLVYVPWTLGHDTVRMLILAARRDNPDDDRFTTVTLDEPASADRRAGWEAAAATVLAATPGSVVVDAGAEHDNLVTHQPPVGDTGLRRAVTR
ncbi:MAG TPA: Na+/H+ antiporter subunit E [Pseudonocardiaceae bacterium]|jgi:multisubunit Na+/H+ antiporter MnhE subunit|nr:Na+/H+ antiporter subunit E [Pseudonocardiaceae bacterium]